MMTTSELKHLLREKRITPSLLKKAIEDGRLVEKELIEENLITSDELAKLLRVSPEEHKRNIDGGSYTLEKMRELLLKGEVSREEFTKYLKRNIIEKKYTDSMIKNMIFARELDSFSLVQEGILTQDHLDDILDVPLPLLDIGFDSWDQIPPL